MSAKLLAGILRPSPREVIQQAAALIAARSAGRSIPVVGWQWIGERIEDFDRRMLAERARLPAGVVLLSVCEPHPEPLPGVQLIEFPAKLFRLLHPSRKARYRVAYGGRGSGKSYSFILALVLMALTEPVRIVCCREVQRSIRESVHRLITETIDRLGLQAFFEVQQYSITSVAGAEFLFEGLFGNVSRIKSLQGINIALVEEAERVTDASFETLTPTIREKGSEIWIVFNPNASLDPVYSRFVGADPPGLIREHVNFNDNPWFPEELEREREYLARVDDDAYRHIWLGEPRQASDAQILRGKFVVEDFTPAAGWDGPYFGLDFGFSQDPTAAVKCWIHERVLYVEHEIWAIGCDIDKTPELLDRIPGARDHVIRADCSRPETISYLVQHGFHRCLAVTKWHGSVEDGIAHLRSYEKIIIHPRCKHTAEEARLYSYKIDRLTGDVLPDVVDANNHCLDALRYSLMPLMSSAKMGALLFIADEKARRAAN